MTISGKTLWKTKKNEENLTQKSQAKLRPATVNFETMVEGVQKLWKPCGLGLMVKQELNQSVMKVRRASP